VKNLLPITESKALAGRGEQINPAVGPLGGAKEAAEMMTRKRELQLQLSFESSMK